LGSDGLDHSPNGIDDHIRSIELDGMPAIWHDIVKAVEGLAGEIRQQLNMDILSRQSSEMRW
jgi:hypothetical protein